MSSAPNVVPLRRDLPPPDDDEQSLPANVLGILHRKDFELWVCRSPEGALTLKWWRWRADLERFCPLEEGELTLDAADLQPLAEVLVAVDAQVVKRELR